MPTPVPLFDDEHAARPNESLAVGKAARRPQDRRERTVSRLIARIDLLRQQVDRERERLDQALVLHAAQVGPRLRQVAALKTTLVRALQPYLDDRRIKAADREVLAHVVANQVEQILAQDESPGADILELFERLHGVNHGEVVQEEIDQARSEMSAMLESFGLDVELPELRADMSPEELAACAATLAERLEQAESASAARPRGRSTRRQQKEEERQRRVEELRRTSIGTVYRRLSKALHPDLERDAAVRERKSAMMQEVTAAYARNDLHTLLRLEQEWLNDEGNDAPRAAETLDAYAQLLKQQVAELEAERLELPFHPKYAPLLAESGPFGMPGIVDVHAESARLEHVIESLRAGIEQLSSSRALQEVRALIREARRAARVRRRPF